MPKLGGAVLCQRLVSNEIGRQAKTLAVRLADCDGHRSLASILVNRMYAWRGYGTHHRLTADTNRVTFTASSDRDIIGTLTLGVDTNDGLAADETFRAELDELRRVPGARLCELTKFACDPTSKSQAGLAALFHVILIYGTVKFACTDLVIEVHPRHVPFYEKLLGFKRVGSPRLNPDVTWWPSDVPVQLMWIRVEEIRKHIRQHAGQQSMGVRSLYPHFFTEKEEQGIWSRIAALAVDPCAQAPRTNAQGRRINYQAQLAAA